MVSKEVSDKSGEKPWEVELGDHILLFFPPTEHRRSCEEIGISLEKWGKLVISLKEWMEIAPTTVFASTNKDGSPKVVTPPDYSGKLRVNRLIFRWQVWKTGFRERFLNIAGDPKETSWHRAQFCLELPKKTTPGRKMAKYQKAWDFYRENREAVWCVIFEKCDSEKEKS